MAKWLRIMGYDTEFPRGADDNDLVCVALLENRALVIWDSDISRRRAVRQGLMRLVHIKDDDLCSQLRQLVRGLTLNLEGEFSRCVRCNELLHPVEKVDVASRLPSNMVCVN